MKRRLFKLVLFLLLGAIVNIAIAFACAGWSHVSYSYYLPQSSSNHEMMNLFEENKIYAASGNEFKSLEQKGVGVYLIEFFESEEFHINLIKGPPPIARYVESGFPLLSMRGGRINPDVTGNNDSFPDTYINWGIIPLSFPEEIDHPSQIRAYLLPLYPIWGGLLITKRTV